MIKKSLLLFTTLFLFVISSCTNLINSSTTSLDFTIGDAISTEIMKTAGERSQITDESLFIIECNIKGFNRAAESITTTKNNLSRVSFSIDNIPIDIDFTISINVLFNGITIYEGQSQNIKFTKDNLLQKVQVVLNKYKSKIAYDFGTIEVASPEQPRPAQYFIDETLTLTAPTSIIDGYEFAGWYVDKEFTKPVKTLGASNYLGDVTLYARWAMTVAKVTDAIKAIQSGENKILDIVIKYNDEFLTLKNEINKCQGTVGINLFPGTGITEIPNDAFKDCIKLTSINIMPGFIKLGVGAFGGCEKLSVVTLPEGLKTIEAWNFGKTKITDIIIPSTVDDIADYAFQTMPYLKTADLSKITNLKNQSTRGFCMFRNDPVLEKVLLPSCMTDLPGGIFNGCTKLIELGEYNKLVESKGYEIKNNCVIKNNKMIMALVNSPTDTISIPSGVKIVSTFTFGSLEFNKLVIPQSVHTLERMFYTDANITEFNFDDTTSTWAGECYGKSATTKPTNNFTNNKTNFVENSSFATNLPHDANWHKLFEVSNLAVAKATGENKVTLSWTNPDFENISEILITSNPAKTITYTDSVASGTKCSIEVSDLSVGTTTFTVKVKDNLGNISLGTTKDYLKMRALTESPKVLASSSYTSTNPPASGSWTYVEFGDWPQTKYSGDETALIPCGEGVNGWDKSVCFADINGEYYVKVKAKPDSTVTDYINGTDYYFKLEPIQWRVLTNKNGKKLLLAEKALAASCFYKKQINRTMEGKTIHPSNYKESDIRAYLNGIGTFIDGGFLQKAFTPETINKITATEVDNSVQSTIGTGDTSSTTNQYACGNTTDKIFLLSEKEVTTAEYGFGEYNANDSARKRTPTDYAKATGIYVSNNFCWWWLRSPTDFNDLSACVVHYNGNANDYRYVNDVIIGVVPALSISFN